MVIGNGLIASHFKSYNNDEKVLIFASGVSNSSEANDFEFLRELNLVKEMIGKYNSAKFIYFSTLSINDSSVSYRPYVKHKLIIEKHLFNYCKNFLIIRVSNVVGSSKNKNTMLNFFINAIKNNAPIEIWKNAERNLIDIEDLFIISDKIIKTQEFNNQVINIASSKNLTVFTIIKEVEKFLNLKANINIVNKGSKLLIDLTTIKEQLKLIEAKKGSGKEYLSYLLKKYY
tara:strand:+ start:1278 stop:1967 length:690 start_codon:yes stop_codon:yes gene_type:complete